MQPLIILPSMILPSRLPRAPVPLCETVFGPQEENCWNGKIQRSTEARSFPRSLPNCFGKLSVKRPERRHRLGVHRSSRSRGLAFPWAISFFT